MEIPNALKDEIEKAFQYRGHVTITFHDGTAIEGYLYNREFTNPKLKNDNFIDVFLKGSGVSTRYPIASIASVTLTGADEAEGKSYQDWIAKKAKEESSHAG